jgi:hypothetical protein
VINIKNIKKTDKITVLPDIKVNIILNENPKGKGGNVDSDDSDTENNVYMKFKFLLEKKFGDIFEITSS